MGLWPQHRASIILTPQHWQLPEIIAVLAGLIFPVSLSLVGLWYAQHKPISLLRNMSTVFVIGGLSGLIVAISIYAVYRANVLNSGP